MGEEKGNDFGLSVGLNTGLFGCFDDMTGCIFTTFLPCIPSAYARCSIDERECNLCDGLCGPNPYQTRQSMRKKYDLEFSPQMDFFSHWCCGCCALNQNVREIAHLSQQPAKWS